MTRWRVWLAFPFAVAVLAVVVWYVTAPSFTDFRRDADRIREELSDYRQQHGRYPSSFEEAGIDPPPANRYGSWRYEPRPDGLGFTLALGEQWMLTYWGP
jgi:hypothetical protein